MNANPFGSSPHSCEKQGRYIFQSGLPGFKYCVKLVEEYVLQFNMPRLYAHFSRIGLHLPIVLTPWLHTFFTYEEVSREFSLLLWDHFFLDGFETVIRTIVGFFYIGRTKLMHCKTDTQAIRCLKSMKMKDPKRFFALIWKLRLPKDVLHKARKLDKEHEFHFEQPSFEPAACCSPVSLGSIHGKLQKIAPPVIQMVV